ncbi:MAG: hypothetical protein EA352_02135 [Gemmatimonadales bacterium]|nr:MAG: hypothetical protein EA352_02135 [Gemmatimonadales bacterium]
MKTTGRTLLATAVTLFLVVPGLAAQQGQMGTAGDLMFQDPLEAALEHAEELGLAADLLEEIRAAHEASVERTRDEREAVAPMLERIKEMAELRRERGEARQGAMQNRQGMQRGQGQGMGQNRQGMMQNRQGQGAGAAGARMEAMQAVQDEFRSNLEWLAEHLGAEQLEALEKAIRPEGPSRS